MKKYIALLFTLIFMCCASLSVFALNTEFTIKAEQIVASPGDTVELKFSFENNPGISLFTLAIDYDQTKLELKQINGNSLMGGSFNCNPSQNFVLWYSSGSDSTFEGTVFNATFFVKEDAAGGQTEVKVSLPNQSDDILNYNGENIPAQIVAGCIDIENTIIYGDANDDGVVNARDYAMLIQYLNGWAVTINTNAADVNKDSAINARDYAMLIQHLNGWNVELQKKY